MSAKIVEENSNQQKMRAVDWEVNLHNFQNLWLLSHMKRSKSINLSFQKTYCSKPQRIITTPTQSFTQNLKKNGKTQKTVYGKLLGINPNKKCPFPSTV